MIHSARQSRRTIAFSILSLLVLLVADRALTVGSDEPDQPDGRGHDSMLEDEKTIYSGWMGLGISSLLRPFQSLSGEPVVPLETDLVLWILIKDRECLVCLDELKLLAAFVDSLNCDYLDVRAVALGDRHEARRTLWGIKTGMPVMVSVHEEVLESLGGNRTPVRVISWHGRIVGLSRLSISTVEGYKMMHDLMHRWIMQ